MINAISFTVEEIFRSKKFGTIYGVRALVDIRKEDIPMVTVMRRFKDDIDHVSAGDQFGVGFSRDPGLKIGQSYTLADWPDVKIQHD